ncbi:MAG: hypothetical protein ACAI35_06445 [Candidatus Methylacidiphilales bacterium]
MGETTSRQQQKKKKNFRADVEATPHLKYQWKSGLGALRPEDKLHIVLEDTSTSHLKGSVDIDSSLRSLFPNSNRWDFAIGYKHVNLNDEVIYWVEFHTGTDNQIKVVLAKLDWLKSWLNTDGVRLTDYKRKFIWAPSGRTSFTKGSVQVKQLASRGITYTGANFKIALNFSK